MNIEYLENSLSEKMEDSNYKGNTVQGHVVHSIGSGSSNSITKHLASRPLIIVGMFMTVLSMASLFGLFKLTEFKSYDPIINLYLIVTGVALIMIDELFLDKRKMPNSRNNEKIKKELEAKYSVLEQQFNEFKNQKNINISDLNEKEYEDILDKVRNSIDGKLTSEVIEKLVSESAPKSDLSYVQEISYKFRERVEREIVSLSGRANINLFIGAITTVFGIGMLAYMLIYGGFTYSETTSLTGNVLTDYMLYYIPRLSIVIFIEVFSYFFLRLYRANLNDIKYFQNELTNIESKLTALNIAVHSNDHLMIKSVVDSLLATERNFVLKKGETTIDLEVSKMDAQKSAETTKILQSVFKETKSLIKIPK